MSSKWLYKVVVVVESKRFKKRARRETIEIAARALPFDRPKTDRKEEKYLTRKKKARSAHFPDYAVDNLEFRKISGPLDCRRLSRRNNIYILSLLYSFSGTFNEQVSIPSIR
jgi:hypothetical protein